MSVKPCARCRRNPAHPVYGEICEDCYVDSTRYRRDDKRDSFDHVEYTQSAVTPRVQQFGGDRRWRKPKPQNES